jgi:hypothetical protein
MTKEDLILLTLSQLKESFEQSPECFTVEDYRLNYNNFQGHVVVWKFKIELNGNVIQDPNNAVRTVTVGYNTMNKTITASIFFREVYDVSYSMVPDASINFKYTMWPWLYKSYRIFIKLRKDLLARRREKQNMDYVKKLLSIFPATGDDDLFG